MQIRLLVAAALLINAVVGHILFRTFFADAGRQPVLTATVLALFVVAIAAYVVFRPTRIPLQLARGLAAMMLLGLAVMTFIQIAITYGDGVATSHAVPVYVQIMALAAVQATILWGTMRIEAVGVVQMARALPAGTLMFWGVVAVLGFIESIID
jgi:hypothetical protein